MKQIFICLFLLVGCFRKIDVPTYADAIIKGIWFSYIDFRDYMQASSQSEFEKKVDQVIKRISDAKFNTIYVHAVAFTDAFYHSKIYPQTTIVDVENVDILQTFIKKAHAKGLRVEAWINPMRSLTPEEMATVPDTYTLKQWVNEGLPYVKLYNNRYYLNPAYEAVNELIVSVVEEILDNYDVDGIHMDDYFYPEGIDSSFDAEANKGGKTLAQFRKDNVNQMVASINQVVKRKNNIFGISPTGNMQYNVDSIYADVERWVDTEIVDYLIPQIYWGYNHPTKPYLSTLAEWMNLVADSNVDLIVGLAAYKLNKEDAYAKDAKDEWINNPTILANQYVDAMASGAKGVAVFSYHSLFETENVSEVVSKLQYQFEK